MQWARTATRLGAASIIGIAMTAFPQAAAGESPPVLALPAIAGVPVVGNTLTASAGATGDPAPTLSYQWVHCAADSGGCRVIDGATASAFVVGTADLGRRLAVRVRAENTAGADQRRSDPTAVVTAPPPPEPTPVPTPTPTPTPEPTPTPTPDPPDPALPTFDQSSPSPARPTDDRPSYPPAPVELASERPPFLRPFPVVRIKGTLVPGGARVTRLRIRAPDTARVVVRCARSGCRFFSRSIGGGRVRALERFLPSRTRITVLITRPGMIGKHVEIVIRDDRAPRRRDACLMPGSTRPVQCPAR